MEEGMGDSIIIVWQQFMKLRFHQLSKQTAYDFISCPNK